MNILQLVAFLIACRESPKTHSLPSSSTVDNPVPREVTEPNPIDVAANDERPEDIDEAIPSDDDKPSEDVGCKVSQRWESHTPSAGQGIRLTAQIDSSMPTQNLIVDLIDPSNEIVFGFICYSSIIDIHVPKDLGTVQIASFVDGDYNGPSKSDQQGLSDSISIRQTDINAGTLSIGDQPIEIFNFSENNADNEE